MKKILFVCSGNTCRSPMAEGLFRKIAFEKDIQVEVLSAGIFAEIGSQAAHHAIQVALEKGVDIKNHKSQNINDLIMKDADFVLTMTLKHKELLANTAPQYKDKISTLKEYNHSKRESLDIKDPYGGDKEAYKKCAEEIEKELMTFTDNLKKENHL